jgi:hypothetical protein
MNITRILFFLAVAAMGLAVVFFSQSRSTDPGTLALGLAQRISSTSSTDPSSESCYQMLFANAKAEDPVLCFKLNEGLETAKQKVAAAILGQNNLTANPWTDDAKLQGSGTIISTPTGDLWFAVALLEPKEQPGTTYGRIVYHTGH